MSRTLFSSFEVVEVVVGSLLEGEEALPPEVGVVLLPPGEGVVALEEEEEGSEEEEVSAAQL